LFTISSTSFALPLLLQAPTSKK